MKKISIISVFLLNVLFAFSQITYQYDNLNRLTNVNYPNGTSVVYAYDELGNRLNKTVVSTVTTNAGYYDLEADGGFNLDAVKLGIVEAPFIDRCIGMANMHAALGQISNLPGNVFTVYRENRRVLTDGRIIPYYSFSLNIGSGIELFLNVTPDSLVLWSQLSAADKAALLDPNVNPDALPGYKFCLPYQVDSLGNKKMTVYNNLMFPAVYLQTMDNDPYLLAAGGASILQYIAAKKLSSVMTNGNIDPTQLTSWIFGAAPATVAVTGVSLNQKFAALIPITDINGDGIINDNDLSNSNSLQLTANITPTDATNKIVTWKSWDTAVATVTGTGLVKAIAEGTVAIYVTTEDGAFTDTCYVTVKRTLSRDASLAELTVSQGALTPAFNPAVTEYTVSVADSVSSIVLSATANNSGASVDGTGTMPLEPGDNIFYITVTSEDGGYKATYTVTVNRAVAPATIAVTGVSLDKHSVSLEIGSSEQLTATVLPSNATNKNVTWKSWNTSVATVTGTGLITALTEGTALINVVTADGSFADTCYVTVKRTLSSDASLAGLTISQGALTPAFNPAITEYTVSVADSISSIVLSANANSGAAFVEGTGTMSLEPGINIFYITVTAENGDRQIYTVIVNRAVNKPEVEITDETPVSADGKGSMTLSLTIPANSLFSGSFVLTLPEGVHLDLTVTHLADSLSSALSLTITQNADGSWLFTIAPLTLRSVKEMVYSRIVEIGYTVDATVAKGVHEGVVSDLSFEFDNGTIVEENELPVTITVNTVITGIPDLSAETVVYMHKGNLYIQSPVAETVRVYSISGVLLFNFQKTAGLAHYPVNQSKGAVLIVKGSSGWVNKVIKN